MPPRTNLKAKLQAQMKAMSGSNGMEKRGSFIPEGYLRELFTASKLKKKLQEDFSFLESRQLDRLTDKIRTQGRRLYATLLLMDESQLIIKLLELNDPIDDSVFSAAMLSKERKYRDTGMPNTLRSLKQVDELSDVADTLYETQWIIPPSLPPDSHLSFPVEHFVFPFLSQPKKISNGSYGVVYGVEVAKGHVELPKGYGAATELVYKKVGREGRNNLEWTKVLNEVTVLRSRQHPNIMPLLASFGAGWEKQRGPDDTEEFLYMISPRAVGNMREWMEQQEESKTQDIEPHEIHEAMMGLVSALAYIHQEFAGKVAYHHDLKPENILQFHTGKIVWKICDFGCSNLKSADETGTENSDGTRNYAPPEFFEGGRKPGRAHDVFSLGCVFLEMATMLKYGWRQEGLPKFRWLRLNKNGGKNHQQTSSRPDASFWKNLDIVHDWIIHLREDNTPESRLVPILSLIKEMLLNHEQRIFAWEVEVDMFEILHPSDKEAVIKRLERVAQESRKPNNGLEVRHNPLIRAKKRKRPADWLQILESRKWFDYSPEPTDELKDRTMSVDTYYSTLPVPSTRARYYRQFDHERQITRGFGPLYGRHDLDQKITRGFRRANSVALYGMGGIGKTHMAYHYALRFKEASHEAKKHTFWVEADSVSSIYRSYLEIAIAVRLSLGINPNPEDLRETVKGWLENRSRGRWLMVVDGLDAANEATELKRLLPEESSGQILITARNRDLLGELIPLKQSEVCIEVELPNPDESLKIFEHYVDGALVNADTERTKELLRDLHLPLVIEIAAKYITKKQISSKEMHEDIKENKFAQIDRFQPEKFSDFMEFLLRPLLQQSRSESAEDEQSKNKSEELRLLCLLSALHKDDIHFPLVCAFFPPDYTARVRDMLATLVNSAFLKKLEDDKYAMHEFVQSGIIRWIKKKGGLSGILEKHHKVLATLYYCYSNDKKNKHGHQVARYQRSSILWKLPYMPHFERFLLFTKEDGLASTEAFRFEDLAVMAVITFCHVYLDEGRYDDAIRVLEFVQVRYHGDYRWELGRILIEAYLSRPSGRDARSYWDKSKKILDDLMDGPAPTKNPKLKWDLLLDRVRVCCKSQQYKRAWVAFEPLKGVKLRLKNGRAVPPTRILGCDLNESERKRLAIKARREEGLIHLAQGKNLSDKNRAWCVKRELQAARSAFIDCRIAIKTWFRKESDWIMEVKINIADANIKIASPELLIEAEKILKKRLQKLRKAKSDNQSGNQRIWETECKLAAVRMKGDKDQIEKAVSTLTRVLKDKEDFYGQGQHSAVRKCAYQLRKAYFKAGRLHEARELEEKFPDMQELKHELDHWAFGQTLLWAHVAVLMCSIFVLFCKLYWS